MSAIVFDLGVGALAPGAIHQNALLAGVDEEHLTAPVAQTLARVLVARPKPQADGNLRGVEELTGPGRHAVHHVGFEHRFADRAFARLLRRHGTTDQHYDRRPVERKVMVDVLERRVVGIAHGRRAKLPAQVFTQAVVTLVGDMEWGTGENVVSFEIAQLVLMEAALIVPADIGVDAAHGAVHLVKPRNVGHHFAPNSCCLCHECMGGASTPTSVGAPC